MLPKRIIELIDDSETLSNFCVQLSQSSFVTVDTEFIRDRTYWPRLCLIQIANTEVARAIDPLASGINLNPLIELLTNPNVIKVFHAARQDIEIFIQQNGVIPTPLFDTQIKANSLLFCKFCKLCSAVVVNVQIVFSECFSNLCRMQQIIQVV